MPATPSSPLQPLDLSPPADTTPSYIYHFSDHKPDHIVIISAPDFALACHLEGSTQFSLQLQSKETTLFSMSTTSEPADLSGVPPEYHDFADVFSKSKASQLASHCKHDLKINLEEGTSPPLGCTYSLSTSELESLQKFLDEEHLANSFIHPFSFTHAALVLFLHKNDGTLCLCIDFRGLNKITKKDRYPLSRISDLLDALSHAKIYTKIDFQHAYHLVHIAEGDKWKTSFCTHYGSYEWLVMPFDLTNAPAVFQWFINIVFTNLLDVCIIVYLDDILIYSEDKASHREHIWEVLQHLHKHGLYTKPEKCEFHTDSTEYLGYCLSPSGLTMSEVKVQAIQDWPKPQKVKAIQPSSLLPLFHLQLLRNHHSFNPPHLQVYSLELLWQLLLGLPAS